METTTSAKNMGCLPPLARMMIKGVSLPPLALQYHHARHIKGSYLANCIARKLSFPWEKIRHRALNTGRAPSSGHTTKFIWGDQISLCKKISTAENPPTHLTHSFMLLQQQTM